MSGIRRVGAVGAGILQEIIGLVLAFLSIESIGLVSDDEFALNGALAIPSLCLLGTIGITVSYASGHPRWLRVGATSAALALVVALVASIAIGSVAAGALLFAVVQLLPAVLPSRFAADGMHAPASPPGPSTERRTRAEFGPGRSSLRRKLRRWSSEPFRASSGIIR